jgi:hypothetical protein
MFDVLPRGRDSLARSEGAAAARKAKTGWAEEEASAAGSEKKREDCPAAGGAGFLPATAASLACVAVTGAESTAWGSGTGTEDRRAFEVAVGGCSGAVAVAEATTGEDALCLASRRILGGASCEERKDWRIEWISAAWARERGGEM